MTKKIKPNVLQSPDDIRQTLSSPAKKTSHLGFHTRSNGILQSRLGLAIPKRLAKRAIDRNRIKRVIREEFRKADIPIADLVVKLNLQVGKRTKNKLREAERKYIRAQVVSYFEEKV